MPEEAPQRDFQTRWQSTGGRQPRGQPEPQEGLARVRRCTPVHALSLGFLS